MSAKTMAEVLYAEGARCGGSDCAGSDACKGCRDTCEGYEKALTIAGFGNIARALRRAQGYDDDTINDGALHTMGGDASWLELQAIYSQEGPPDVGVNDEQHRPAKADQRL